MLQRWRQWNRKAKLLVWIIAIIGVIAALPLGMNRMDMEASSKSVEYILTIATWLIFRNIKPVRRSLLMAAGQNEGCWHYDDVAV